MIAPSSEQPDLDTVNLPAMTKAQLKSYAADNGIEVDGGMKKADLIATIEDAMN